MDKYDSFLRIVTDGTLLTELNRSPFLSGTKAEPSATDYNGHPITWANEYTSGNIYDIVIVDEAHEHNDRMDIILTLARDALYVNNSLKLVIVSATMDDDEPIYRRYYRTINDNRAYPLNAYIDTNQLDRANMDRRIHISKPGGSTQYFIKEIPLPKAEADLVNEKNYVSKGIEQTIKVVNSTTVGDILLFMAGEADIRESIEKINKGTPANVVCLGFYSKMLDEDKTFIEKIDKNIKRYTRFKEDVLLEEKDVSRRVAAGTYNRAVIVATNVAEASITLPSLRYVIDTGYAKVNTYDPLEDVKTLITMPISNSSSKQRKGRVGRTSTGTVYYMYDEAKIINNKTAYQIADSDIRDIMIDLLKSYPIDIPIVTDINNINDIEILCQIQERKQEQSLSPNLLTDLLKNPYPYLGIITKQYMYLSNTADPDNYYTHFGKSHLISDTIIDPNMNIRRYLVENHDDYEYQMNNKEFASRCHTGYDDVVLLDDKLNFFIIHPDENVIRRNLFTGEFIGLKPSDAVTPGYYYYLLKQNEFEPKEMDITQALAVYNEKLNLQQFTFQKTSLAINLAILQVFVINVDASDIDTIGIKIKSDKIRDPNNYEEFIKNVNENYRNPGGTTLIKSSFLNRVNEIRYALSLDILNDRNYLLWFVYALPYDIDVDVIALICMVKTVPDITEWFVKFEATAKLSYTKVVAARAPHLIKTNANKTSDIYFLWNLWTDIKETIFREEVLKQIEIPPDIETIFKLLKSKYLNKEVMPLEQYKLFKKLYESGKLNTRDEVYNYILAMTSPNIRLTSLKPYIKHICQKYSLDPSVMEDFLTVYIYTIWETKRKMWTYHYEVAHNIIKTIDKQDLIESTKQNMILRSPFRTDDPSRSKGWIWTKLFESYLRAYSSNLMKYEHGLYLKIDKGFFIDPWFWTKIVKIEKTFVQNKMEYLVYQVEQSNRTQTNVAYITPVKLEWILELNPVYYYYFLFNRQNVLLNLRDDEAVREALKVREAMRKSYDLTALLDYINRLNDPYIARIIHNNVLNSKNRSV